MLGQYVAPWKKKSQPGAEVAVLANKQRRTPHGGTAWTRVPADALRQPQDGALHDNLRVADISARPGFMESFMESEDARLTGGTRSLMRRLMGLNMGRKLTPAAIRAAKNQPQVA